MTLEEQVAKIWSVNVANQLEVWPPEYAEKDLDRECSKALHHKCREVEKIIKENLAVGLTSNNKYVRRYAELLSQEDSK